MAVFPQFYSENGPQKRDKILCTVSIFYAFRILLFQSGSPLFPTGWEQFLSKIVATDQSRGTNIYGNSLLKCTEEGDKTSHYSYPLARNQYMNNSPGIFSCIRAGANTGASCIHPERSSLKNLANMQKMTPQTYFPVCARVRIQAPHVFAKKLIPQELRFRGPGRRSLEARSKKSQKSPEKVSKKVSAGSRKSEKSLERGPKSLQKPIFGFFFDYSDLFQDFFQTFGTPAPGDLFETFSRLFGFGPRDSFSQVHGTSTQEFFAACIGFVPGGILSLSC